MHVRVRASECEETAPCTITPLTHLVKTQHPVARTDRAQHTTQPRACGAWCQSTGACRSLKRHAHTTHVTGSLERWFWPEKWRSDVWAFTVYVCRLGQHKERISPDVRAIDECRIMRGEMRRRRQVHGEEGAMMLHPLTAARCMPGVPAELRTEGADMENSASTRSPNRCCSKQM